MPEVNATGRTLSEQEYRRHAGRLMALAAVLVGPDDADDLVSAVIERVFAAPGWERVQSPEAYLTRAVVNEARSSWRSAQRRRQRDTRWVREGRSSAGNHEVDPAVAAALARLSTRQRAVVFFTYWADYQPDAIAEVLNISEGSVRKHLARARATLRRELA